MNAGYGRVASQISACVQSRVSLSPAKIRLTLSGGFPYEAFDGNANLKPWHIINLVENMRAQTFWEGYPLLKSPQFLHMDKILQRNFIFQVAADLRVKPAAYDLSISKYSLVVEKELVYVGKTTFAIKTTVFSPPPKCMAPMGPESDDYTGTELASNITQSVAVDMTFRCPETLPDWWREKYQMFSNADHQIRIKPEQEPSGKAIIVKAEKEQLHKTIQPGNEQSNKKGKPDNEPVSKTAKQEKGQNEKTVEQEKVPEKKSGGKKVSISEKEKSDKTVKPETIPQKIEVKSYKLRVNQSDIDPYLHVNWSAYFKYCLDGILSTALVENNQSLMGRKVKKMEVLFMREGKLSEWLDVRFWPAADSDDILYCNIVSADRGEVLSYIVVEFYPAQYFDPLTEKL